MIKMEREEEASIRRLTLYLNSLFLNPKKPKKESLKEMHERICREARRAKISFEIYKQETTPCHKDYKEFDEARLKELQDT